jgi:Fic-DOC domain mobile mystery protein B
MSEDPFAADGASTPLTPEDRRDLIPSYVTLRHELNEVEALNVRDGERWAFARKRDALDEDFLKRLHKRMFGQVWRWAGRYRDSPRSIGVEPWRIEVDMRQALDDGRFWVANKSWPADELAARMHHRLVLIHPFPNGNGRWSRLAADLLAVQLGRPRFTWGSTSLVAQSQTRQDYVAALREADTGDLSKLLAFVRS